MKLIQFFEAEASDVFQTYDSVQKEIDDVYPYVDSDDDQLFEFIERRLLDAGLERLGTGQYSVVFSKPGSDFVVKVTRPRIDKCVSDFLKMSRRHTKNRHFPKVFKIKRFPIPRSRHAIVVAQMEKLFPLSYNKLRLTKDDRYNFMFILFLLMNVEHANFDYLEASSMSYHEKLLINLLFNNKHTFEFIEQNKRNGTMFKEKASKSIKDLIEVLSLMDNNTFTMEAKWWLNYYNTPFTNAIKTILELVDSNYDCELDLHSNNLMMRKNGTIVFSDPVLE